VNNGSRAVEWWIRKEKKKEEKISGAMIVE
jgi:hypothetical protein